MVFFFIKKKKTGSCQVDQAGFKFVILILQFLSSGIINIVAIFYF